MTKWPEYRSAAHCGLTLALTLGSVAYTYLVSWGFDEGFLTLGGKWRNLDWHLSCGAVFALPVLSALRLDLRHRFPEAIGIVLVCAVTNPIAIFGPGLFLTFIPPWWVTGAVSAAFISVAIALLVRKGSPPLWQFLLASLCGGLAGLLFIQARLHSHYKGCASEAVCVPIEWVLPGYLVWQGGLVASLFLYPGTKSPDEAQTSEN